MEKYGKAAKMDLVFHGGSGSSQAEIHETPGLSFTLPGL